MIIDGRGGSFQVLSLQERKGGWERPAKFETLAEKNERDLFSRMPMALEPTTKMYVYH
jgi:hypothetical protein